jgi:hypothetical protein
VRRRCASGWMQHSKHAALALLPPPPPTCLSLTPSPQSRCIPRRSAGARRADGGAMDSRAGRRRATAPGRGAPLPPCARPRSSRPSPTPAPGAGGVGRGRGRRPARRPAVHRDRARTPRARPRGPQRAMRGRRTAGRGQIGLADRVQMRAEIAPARRARPSGPLLGAIAPRAAPDNPTTVAARGTAPHPAGRPVACWFAPARQIAARARSPATLTRSNLPRRPLRRPSRAQWPSPCALRPPGWPPRPPWPRPTR